LNASVYFI